MLGEKIGKRNEMGNMKEEAAGLRSIRLSLIKDRIKFSHYRKVFEKKKISFKTLSSPSICYATSKVSPRYIPRFFVYKQWAFSICNFSRKTCIYVAQVEK